MVKQTKFLIIVSVVSLYLLFSTVSTLASHDGKLRVIFLDIGQGDSIYIEAPNGNQMLIDGGRSWNILAPALHKVMPPNDDSIDVVLATHPDADHIGGLPTLLSEYKVGTFIEPGMKSSTKVYQSLLDSVNDDEVKHIYGRTGMNIVLDGEDDISFSVISPDNIEGLKETNDASIVGILKYGNEKFLLNGDAPIDVEDKILLKNTDVKVNVLKLGHHGSRTSSSEEFLRATNPEVVVISAGCNNTYGHPHKEVLALLAKINIPSVATCSSGNIEYDTDGGDVKQKTEKKIKRGESSLN